MEKINLKQLPTLWPHDVNWTRYFNNQAPVDLEIGCGRTHFFFDRALYFPHRNIVGVEWVYEFTKTAQNRIVHDRIKNAAAFHGNAWLLVPLLFRKQSLSQIFVNFPDPWWKNRHKKRLVLNHLFLSALKERIKDDGFMLLQTDVLELFNFYRNLVDNHGEFYYDEQLKNDDIIALIKAKTHREKKCLAQGLPIYRGVFRPQLK